MKLFQLFFAPALLSLMGCTAQKPPAPALVVAPGPTPAPTPFPAPIMVATPAMPMPIPDPERARQEAIIDREIQRLSGASPDADFAQSWANGDKKFVAIRGVGWYLPGVPQQRQAAMLDLYDATPIEGTTDAIWLPEKQGKLGRLAAQYARRYNQLLLEKLDAQNAATGG